MEIKGTGRIETSSVKRKTSASAAASGFSVSDTSESQAQAIVAGPGPIAALDSILMLQGLDDSTQG
ncbi:MAG TPA: flagellar assembly protein FliX, partial [Rhizomicrobium sp.]|nr:flagellar assembly protein FliX [Rhizomicrobium sp.]